MSKKTGLFLLVGALLWASAGNTKSFNEEQKNEIEQIIQEYLNKHPEVVAQAIVSFQQMQIKAWKESLKKTIILHLDELYNSTSPALTVEKPKLSVVEFFDYNCPHCKKFSKILNTTLSQNKDIQVIYKELPILSESSLIAAKAALAAREQNKYQDFHQKLMDYNEILTEEKIMQLAKEAGLDVNKLTADMKNQKIEDEIRNNQKLAVGLGIRGTPAVIIGQYPATKDMPIEFIPGEISQKELDSKISAVRNPPTP